MASYDPKGGQHRCFTGERREAQAELCASEVWGWNCLPCQHLAAAFSFVLSWPNQVNSGVPHCSTPPSPFPGKDIPRNMPVTGCLLFFTLKIHSCLLFFFPSVPMTTTFLPWQLSSFQINITLSSVPDSSAHKIDRIAYASSSVLPRAPTIPIPIMMDAPHVTPLPDPLVWGVSFSWRGRSYGEVGPPCPLG